MYERMNDRHPILDLAESYLREAAPRAAVIDRDSNALAEAFAGLGDRCLLALHLPRSRGGPEISTRIFACFQQLLARYSGALAFLQTQHQSAARMLLTCDREELKQQYLPHMSTGKLLLGVGFSQLRRSGVPPVKAIPVKGGYRLAGTIPWITGFGFFPEFIVGAALPDGSSLFGIAPLTETSNIAVSQPMQLAAMSSTNTVTATLNDWFLPQQRVLYIKPAGWIHQNDKNNVLKHGFFALGCSRAGLDIVENAARIKQLSFIDDAFASLNRELTDCGDAMLDEQECNNLSFGDRLQLRARAIDLAVRCAHAAIAVSSGAANSINHNAQRIYREALVFTVFGQTTAVMEATLSKLTRC